MPLQRDQVRSLADFLWPQDSPNPPHFLLELLEVMAPDGEIPDTPCGLQMISPEGYLHSLLLACARDLPRNQDRWAIVLKSVPCAFSGDSVTGDGGNLPAGDVWVRAWNVRNKISQTYESLSRTAFQQCMEIQAIKSKIESEAARSLTAAELVNELKNRGLKKASSQEDMTPNLVGHAVLIAQRMQQDESMVNVVRGLEKEFGTASCLNKMGLLYAMVSKPTNQNRVWVMESLWHYILSKQIQNEDVTRLYLLGNNNTTSMISVWELKAQVWEQIMGYMLAKAKIKDKDIVLLRQVLADHSTYRSRLLGGDVSWQGQLQPSSLEALTFIEAHVG